jgi:hypothetical protein
MSNYRIIALSLILSFSLICPAYAATYYVDDALGDDLWPGTPAQPKKTISAGIAVAADYDTVVVNDGTYRGPLNRDLRPGSKKITLRSAGGAATCTIDAEGQDRAFKLSGSPAEATFDGFTIVNGANDLMFTSGGGGGGIYALSSDCTIANCVIKDCIAIQGGGLLVRNGATAIRNCIIKDNTATHDYISCHGGGMYIFWTEGVTVEGCVFSGNKTAENQYNGGAVYHERGTGNTVFNNCIFEGNYTYRSGGVLFDLEGHVEFSNCTFYSNESGGRGGCFFISYTNASVTVTNSIFWNNIAASDGDIAYVLSASPTAKGTLNYSYCDIDPAGIEGGGYVYNYGGNINADPLFANPGYSSAGGWMSGDYHLKSKVGRWRPLLGWVQDAVHSPCIDAGDPNDPVGNEPSPNGDRINMGFYGGTIEASKSPYCSGPIEMDFTKDCKVDFADFAKFASYWADCNMVPADFCW